MQKLTLENFIEIDLNALHDQKEQLTLFLLSDLLNKAVDDEISDFSHFSLFEFFIDFDQYAQIKNRLIREEMALTDLSALVVANWDRFNANQLHAINTIVETIKENDNSWNQDQLFFLDEFESTGKIFVQNIVMTKLRSKNVIVFAVIFSDIAVTFLKGDFTAHFKFKIFLDSNDESICSIKKDIDRAELIKKIKLVF